MMSSRGTKHVFWQALVFAIIVFGVGVVLGFFLEDSRINSVQEILLNAELNLLDEQLRNEAIDNFDIGCSEAIGSVYKFADRIFEEAVKLEEYDSASKFQDTLKTLHKKYDLLRMMVWTDAVRLKDRCDADFHTVVYIYEYGIDEVNKRAVQISLGKVLIDLKTNHGEKVLLIPIAGNFDLESINLVKDKFGIEELPVVIVDETEIIKGIISVSELEKIVFG